MVLGDHSCKWVGGLPYSLKNERLFAWRVFRLEAKEEEFIGDEGRNHRFLEYGSDCDENFELFPEVVLAIPSHVEVIDHAIHLCGQLKIQVVIVKDEVIDLAHCRCLHRLRLLNVRIEFEIVECEVGNEVDACVEYDGGLPCCGRVRAFNVHTHSKSTFIFVSDNHTLFGIHGNGLRVLLFGEAQDTFA